MTEIEAKIRERDEDLSEYAPGTVLKVTYRELVWDGESEKIAGLEGDEQTTTFTVKTLVQSPDLRADHLVSKERQESHSGSLPSAPSYTLHSDGTLSWSPYKDAYWTEIEVV